MARLKRRRMRPRRSHKTMWILGGVLFLVVVFWKQIKPKLPTWLGGTAGSGSTGVNNATQAGAGNHAGA